CGRHQNLELRRSIRALRANAAGSGRSMFSQPIIPRSSLLLAGGNLMRTSANLWPRTAVLITVTLVMALSSASSNVSATPDVLELEAERRWTSGTNPTIEDLAIAELVGGGLPEIVSVGGTGTSGEIRVQRYTGSTFFDVVSPVYPVETAKGVATGNLDADPLGVTEIVSVGCGSTTGDISLWVLSGGALN